MGIKTLIHSDCVCCLGEMLRNISSVEGGEKINLRTAKVDLTWNNAPSFEGEKKHISYVCQ